MANYTTNYNLAKPEAGDTDWSAEINGNFDTIDEQIKDKDTRITALENSTEDAEAAKAYADTAAGAALDAATAIAANEGQTAKDYADAQDEVLRKEFSTLGNGFGGGGTIIEQGEVEPTEPIEGALWIDTSNNQSVLRKYTCRLLSSDPNLLTSEQKTAILNWDGTGRFVFDNPYGQTIDYLGFSMRRDGTSFYIYYPTEADHYSASNPRKLLVHTMAADTEIIGIDRIEIETRSSFDSAYIYGVWQLADGSKVTGSALAFVTKTYFPNLGVLDLQYSCTWDAVGDSTKDAEQDQVIEDHEARISNIEANGVITPGDSGGSQTVISGGGGTVLAYGDISTGEGLKITSRYPNSLEFTVKKDNTIVFITEYLYAYTSINTMNVFISISDDGGATWHDYDPSRSTELTPKITNVSVNKWRTTHTVNAYNTIPPIVLNGTFKAGTYLVNFAVDTEAGGELTVFGSGNIVRVEAMNTSGGASGGNVVEPKFGGAMVGLTKEAAALSWNNVYYDTDSFFDPANPDRLTVPEGVKKVRLYAYSGLTSISGSVGISIRKNGASIAGGGYEEKDNGFNNGGGVGKNTPPIEVVAGDYFTVATSIADTSFMFSTNSYFAIEVVEKENATTGGTAPTVSKQWFDYTLDNLISSGAAYNTKGLFFNPQKDIVVHGFHLLHQHRGDVTGKVVQVDSNGLQIGSPLYVSETRQLDESKYFDSVLFEFENPITMLAGNYYIFAASAATTFHAASGSTGRLFSDKRTGFVGNTAPRLRATEAVDGTQWDLYTVEAPVYFGGILIEL